MFVYIAEHKTKSIGGKIINFFTGDKYNHTSMIIKRKKTADKTEPKIDWFFAELNPVQKNKKSDFLIKNINISTEYSLKEYMGKDVDIFKLPVIFTEKQTQNMIDYWGYRAEKNISYGYLRIATFPYHICMRPFYKAYYKTFGIPYKTKVQLTEKEVCSSAIDECVKNEGGYDIFPKYLERFTYPGLYAHKLQDFKI